MHDRELDGYVSSARERFADQTEAKGVVYYTPDFQEQAIVGRPEEDGSMTIGCMSSVGTDALELANTYFRVYPDDTQTEADFAASTVLHMHDLTLREVSAADSMKAHNNKEQRSLRRSVNRYRALAGGAALAAVVATGAMFAISNDNSESYTEYPVDSPEYNEALEEQKQENGIRALLSGAMSGGASLTLTSIATSASRKRDLKFAIVIEGQLDTEKDKADRALAAAEILKDAANSGSLRAIDLDQE